MIGPGGWKAVRAAFVVGALLAASSVVLWPLAVVALPFLFWAACGGTVARWSASLVGALVVFIVAEVGFWLTVGAVRGTPPTGTGWLLAVAVVVAPLALVGFLRGSRTARDRGIFGATAAPSGSSPIPAG